MIKLDIQQEHQKQVPNARRSITAIKLFSDVGVVCHQEAREVFNVMAGDIESLNQDKKQACVSLSYTHLTKGLLIKRGEAVSFILAATLELETA